jgi:hypothetical protein
VLEARASLAGGSCDGARCTVTDHGMRQSGTLQSSSARSHDVISMQHHEFN